MSTINDMKLKIDQEIGQKHLDGATIRGKIGLKAGFVLAFITADTPDDKVKIEKLRQAIKEVLNIPV